MKRWLILISILICISSAEGDVFSPELKIALLETKAKYALESDDYPEARKSLVEALELGGDSVEPLFRLALLQKDPKVAHRVLERYGHLVNEVDKTLFTGALSQVPVDIQAGSLTEPYHYLYYGLILEATGSKPEAQNALLAFLANDEWGRELAEEILLGYEQQDCLMCREREADRYAQAEPVCSRCYTLLYDPVWQRQALYQPTPEQRTLMKNFVGEEFSTVFQETIADIRPDSLRTKGFVPVQDLDALLEALNPKMFECFQVAKGPGDETPSARKFGLAFAEKVHPDHFSTPSDRLEFISKVQALPETVKLEWLLNIANWCHKLSPRPPGEGAECRNLDTAFDYLTGRTDIMARAEISLMSAVAAPGQLKQFEDCLKDHPDDLFLHAVLAQDQAFGFSPEITRGTLAHRLWLIQHHPTTTDGSHWLSEEDRNVPILARAFLRKIEENPNDIGVLGSGASFFSLTDQQFATLLYQKCHALEPENPDWLEKLAQQASFADDSETEYEILKQTLSKTDEESRGFLLPEVAMAAYENGDFERAEELGEELLRIAESEENWNTGNAFHKGHTVLGLVALKSGNQKNAVHHLIESGKTKGSPQLNSFGPNMTLARELLLLGDKDTVVKYLDLCGKFWANPQIEVWKKSIEEGRMPDFGTNLDY